MLLAETVENEGRILSEATTQTEGFWKWGVESGD